MSDDLRDIKSALEGIERKMKDHGFSDLREQAEKKCSWMAKIMELCLLAITANGFLFTITTSSISKIFLVSSVILYCFIIIISLMVMRLSGIWICFFPEEPLKATF